jgi:hypothetical protein
MEITVLATMPTPIARLKPTTREKVSIKVYLWDLLPKSGSVVHTLPFQR